MPRGEPASRHTGGSISIIGLRKEFEGVTAVDGIDLEIKPGEFFTLLGPSGCGKTTTLRMLAGFEQPTDGQILIDGVDVAQTPAHKRPVNTVFQSYALFPHLDVERNVAYGLRWRKELDKETRAARVAKALDLVQLSGYGKRRPHQLSGGQQQRVALARALVNRPAVLLLDEPLGALDLKLRQAMQLELKRIQREVGITFVFVTHDQEEALTMSDRIAVMNEGRVEQIGSPEDIYHQPASEFVAGFIGMANLLPATVDRVGGGRASATLGDGTTIDANASDGLAAGDPATFMIRPERMHLHVGGDAGFEVKVVDLVFQGPLVRFELAAPDGSTLVAHVGPDEELPLLRPGDAVRVVWDADGGRLLRRSERIAAADADALS